MPVTDLNEGYMCTKKRNNVAAAYSSLYTMNLGALSVCNAGVGWNQMSDRLIPSVQKSYKRGKSLRPGAMTPGGVGCDVKHNSYARHLAKMKGKCFTVI